MIQESLEYNASIPNVIVDSDLGGDLDDLHDLATVCAYHKQGLIKLIGYSLTHAWDACDVVTACFRYSGINGQVWSNSTGRALLGIPFTAGTPPAYDYTNTGAASWSGGAYPATYLQTVAGFRKCLASAPNKSVIIIEVAPWNLNGLLSSTADIYSPLTGPQLIGQKVKYLNWAAGNFGGLQFSCTSASPGVLTVGTNIPNGTPMKLASVGGSLPTGFSASTTYYVVNSNGSTTIELSATLSGSPINTSSTGSGTLYCVYPGGGYEFNFGGTDMNAIAALWPAGVPFIMNGIEESAGIGTSYPPNNAAISSSPFMAAWGGFNIPEQAYSYPGMYQLLENCFGPIFTLGGTLGSIASQNPGDVWSQSPSGPYAYIAGNDPATPLSSTLLTETSSRRTGLVAVAALGTNTLTVPINTVLPSVSSLAYTQGSVLTASLGIWSTLPTFPSGFATQWIWGDTLANISAANTATFTCTSASPGVLSVGLNVPNGVPVTLASTGTLPTGLTTGTVYYAVNSNNSTTIELAAAVSGTPINTSSTGSGTMTATFPISHIAQSGDVGHTIAVKVTASNGAGAGTQVTSTATPVITTVVPAINYQWAGTTAVGVYTGDGQASPTWNVSQTSPISSVLYSDGTSAAGVSIAFTNSGSYGTGGTTAPIFQYFMLEGGSATGTITISGLVANGSYQIYLYGQNGNSSNRGTTFSITTGTGSPASGSNASTNNLGGQTYLLNANYVIFNCVANASGVLVISYVANAACSGTPGNTEADVNGFQLVFV